MAVESDEDATGWVGGAGAPNGFDFGGLSCLALLNENGDVDAGLTGSLLAARAGAPKREANEVAGAVEAAPVAGGPNEKDDAGLLSVFTASEFPL